MSLIVYLLCTIFCVCVYIFVSRFSLSFLCCAVCANLSVLNRKLSYLSIIYQINEFEGFETGFLLLSYRMFLVQNNLFGNAAIKR